MFPSKESQKIKKAPFLGGMDLAEQRTNLSGLLLFSCRGTGMGWKLARCGYWLVIVLGTVLLFGRQQEFHILKIVFGVGLPVAFIWVCCSSFPSAAQGSRVDVC